MSENPSTEIIVDAETANLPAVISKNDKYVRRNFWQKMTRVIGRIPFAEDLLAAYYCAIDPKTPTRVRGVLLAALAYFIVPTDFIPDFIAALGFTDDATVIATAMGIVSGHIKERHRIEACKALDLHPPEQGQNK